MSPRRQAPARAPKKKPTPFSPVDRLALEKFDLSRQDQSFSFRMRQLVRFFNRRLSPHLEALGVTLGEWQFLRALWEKEGQSQIELSDQLGLTSAATVFSINLLERDGLACREADKNDRRRFLIYLTPKGRKLRKMLLALARKQQLDALVGFSDEEIRTLATMFDRMKINLQDAAARDVKSAETGKAKPRKTARKSVRSEKPAKSEPRAADA